MTDPRDSVGFGPFLLNPAERLLLKEGRVVPLTPKAFDLLTLLVASSGHLLSKDELIEKLWPGTFVEEANLAYNVSAIRKALGDGSETERYIETVPRRGYRFVGPVAPRATGAHEQPHGADGASGQDGREPPTGPTGRTHLWLAWTVAAITSIGLIGLAVVHFRETPPRSAVIRFEIPAPFETSESGAFAISPNGLQLAYRGAGTDGIVRLWVRDLSTLEPRSLSGTESNVHAVLPLFWSPDSAFVAYSAGDYLMKVSVSGGAPQPVCQLAGTAVGGTWHGQVILVGNPFGGLMQCPATGGSASPVTAPPPSSGVQDLFPSFLPDGQHFIFTRIFRSAPESSGVFVGALGDAPVHKSASRLLMTGFGAAYVDGGRSRLGQILFVRDGTLFAQPFNAHTRELAGNQVRVASPVGSYQDYAFVSVSAAGTLVFRAPDPEVQLTWFDRRGTVVGRVGQPARYSGLALSSDGLRAVAVQQTPKSTMEQEVWLFDLPANTNRQLTFDPLLERSPIWKDDSGGILFTLSGGPSSVYELSVGSTERPRVLIQAGRSQYLCDVSPDQRFLLYSSYPRMNQGRDATELWVQPLGREQKAEPTPLRPGELNSEQGQFSPDGHLVAYVANPAGRREVFVAPLRYDADSVHADRGEQVSKGGGVSPRWGPDGRELLYLAPDASVMAVAVRTDRGIQIGVPSRLFQVPGALPDWGVHPDRTRFIFAVPVRPSPPFEVVLDGVSSPDR
jgi:DNA-binding winged helix-turn-helix (wHTH) protein/Tol biopolymer transport system component